MKRVLFTAFLIALAVLLVSCIPPGPGAATATPGSTPTEEASSVITATPGNTPAAEQGAEFIVASPGIVDGVIDPVYGQNGTAIENGVPILSLPIEISGAPVDAACYALCMDDPDSVPLCGYAWVHWMAANFTQPSLPEGFSADADADVVQGKNDTGTIGYAGPTPPDKDHTYRVTAYALDAPLSLQNGFSKEQFGAALEGHVLASVVVEGIYKK